MNLVKSMEEALNKMYSAKEEKNGDKECLCTTDFKEAADDKKKFTNRFGHEFWVRPGFYRSFGDVLGELSRILFAK